MIKSFFKFIIKLLFGKKSPEPVSKLEEEPPINIQTPSIPPRYNPDYKHVWVDDLPDDFEKEIIYIIGEQNYEWAVAFTCPCGCTEIIQLNLLKDVRPCWTVDISRAGYITINPSVHRRIGCKAHFFITNGKVSWAIFSPDPL